MMRPSLLRTNRGISFSLVASSFLAGLLWGVLKEIQGGSASAPAHVKLVASFYVATVINTEVNTICVARLSVL